MITILGLIIAAPVLGFIVKLIIFDIICGIVGSLYTKKKYKKHKYYVPPQGVDIMRYRNPKSRKAQREFRNFF